MVLCITREPLYNRSCRQTRITVTSRLTETKVNWMLWLNTRISVNHRCSIDPCSYDTAMETDDDGCVYSVASSYLNNNSMILEASAQNWLEANKQQQCQQQGVHNDADTLRRRNRKRCNSDLSPSSELKKFREGRREFIILIYRISLWEQPIGIFRFNILHEYYSKVRPHRFIFVRDSNRSILLEVVVSFPLYVLAGKFSSAGKCYC